jgi:hypothetical protein
MNPPGAYASAISGCDGSIQVGYALTGQPLTNRAGLWNGTAASWADLHPAAAVESYAFCVQGGQQGGVALVGGSYHACVWTGTAGSFVDLAPPGVSYSTISALYNGMQVGNVQIGVYHHASVWNGSAASWFDLQSVTPGYSETYANGIWSDGAFIYVVGFGLRTSANSYQALLWRNPICYANCDGSTAPPILNVNDFQCFLNKYAQGDTYANCDGSTSPPVLNVNDFQCFLNRYAASCP